MQGRRCLGSAAALVLALTAQLPDPSRSKVGGRAAAPTPTHLRLHFLDQRVAGVDLKRALAPHPLGALVVAQGLKRSDRMGGEESVAWQNVANPSTHARAHARKARGQARMHLEHHRTTRAHTQAGRRACRHAGRGTHL